ncbi:MAG: serine/threonine-protein kinase, partial [Syntrophaceae bacterium]|nr:serine/threonine-protein kinase [Syntrophaceae bacterium]
MKIEKNMIIDGYRILEDLPIGEGGWGRVWLAESLSGNIHEKVAIKMLSLNDLMNKCIEEHRNFGSGEDVKCIFSEKIDAFKNEYKNVRKLNHPNIARAYGFGSFDNHLYIASEYVDGTSITSATHNMPIDDIIAYLLQGLLGLEAIHKHGLLHLDIKGENILLTKDGRIKIIDFGLSAAIENLKIRLCGSLPYMAPEVIFQDKSHIGAQSDLYSYGSLMYRCLTGRYPSLQRELMDFDYEKLQKLVREEKFRLPSELRSDIPKYMDKIIMRLISNDYNKRYYGENIRAVINALATHRPDDFRETIEVKGSYLIPKNNEHIGREKEQKFIFNILKQFIGGKQPSPSVIAISGEAGMGKTHLLSKIRDFLGQHSEGFVTCSLDLPAHDDWLTAWNKKTSLAISENAKPVVVIIDNVDKNESSVTIPNNLVQLLNDRLKDPGLFHDTSPLILIFTGLPENINIILQNSGPERSIYYHIQLEPFTKNQVKKYLSLTTALKNHKIPDNWIKKIYEATAGVPLELAERLQIQDSRGLLFGLDGTLHLSTLLEKNEVQRIPESTKSRLTKHCKALCEAEKNIIDLMAVWFKNNFFNSISFDDIYNFYPQSYIRQILDGLIQKRILKHVGILSSYTFYDNFHMSEFFYNNIDENLRNNLHLRISNRLQGIDADGDILHGA